MTGTACLAGRNVIITGASRGIGHAIALAFAAHGARNMVLVGRDAERLAEAQGKISQTSSTVISLGVGDVRHRPFWQTLTRDMIDVDVLVNAAGMAHSSLLVTTTSELVGDVIQTNLMGTIWGCQVVAKAMLRQRRPAHNTGCIINVASLLGVKGGMGSTAYAASKAGVLGLTRSLASELGASNIRVNALVPGYIDTQMTEAMTPQARAVALNTVPQGRFGTPHEVANAAIFLATNTYANNCVLNLDGGLSST